jgi:pimeloyl-ACP methyl ester carboxylesterase
MTREDSVFVPFGEEHLAATLTVPDEEPRGLVLLMTGLGAHRSHRFQIWARAARELAAEHGIASIRFDYKGVGESTGLLGEWPMVRIPTDQAIAVLRFGMDATGARRLVSVGNCGGAWTALMVASRVPECLGAIFIRAPILAQGGLAKATSQARRSRLGRSRLGRLLRSVPFIRKTVHRLANRTTSQAVDLRTAYAKALDHGQLLFLFGEEDFAANEQARVHLDSLRARLPAEARNRYELRTIPGRSLHGFSSLEAQDLTVRTVVDWAASAFEGAYSARSPA